MVDGTTQDHDTHRNGIIGFTINVAPVAHPHPCLRDGKTGIEKHEFLT